MARTFFLNTFSATRRQRSFRYLLLARLASATGTYLALVALTVDILDRTGSATWVSLLLMAEFLPAFAVAFFVGPLIDRWSRRYLLIGSDVLNVVLFCLLAVAGAPWQILMIALVVGLSSSVFAPTVYASLPNLVEKEDLPRANSLLQAVENLAIVCGPVAGGVLVAAGGPRGAYLLNAASYLFSAVCVRHIPAEGLQGERAESHGHWRDFKEGFALVRHARPLVTVLGVWSVCLFALAGLNVALPLMAKEVLAAGDVGFGLMASALGVGLLLGALAAAPSLERLSLRSVYSIAIAVCALGIAGGAVAPTIWPALGCLVVLGIGNGAAVVCNALLIQRGAPDHLRGRAVAVLMGVGNSAAIGGYLVFGPFTDVFSARASWLVAAALLGGASCLALVLAPDDLETESAPPSSELLSLAASADEPLQA